MCWSKASSAGAEPALGELKKPLWGEQTWDLLIACVALPCAVSDPFGLPKLGALAPVSSMSGVALSWCHFLCPPLSSYHGWFLSHLVSVPFSFLWVLSFKSPRALRKHSQLALTMPLEASLWLTRGPSVSPSHLPTLTPSSWAPLHCEGLEHLPPPAGSRRLARTTQSRLSRTGLPMMWSRAAAAVTGMGQGSLTLGPRWPWSLCLSQPSDWSPGPAMRSGAWGLW